MDADESVIAPRLEATTVSADNPAVMSKCSPVRRLGFGWASSFECASCVRRAASSITFSYRYGPLTGACSNVIVANFRVRDHSLEAGTYCSASHRLQSSARVTAAKPENMAAHQGVMEGAGRHPEELKRNRPFKDCALASVRKRSHTQGCGAFDHLARAKSLFGGRPFVAM
jgi:hypothetical protein